MMKPVEINEAEGERGPQQHNRRPEDKRAGGFDGFSEDGGGPSCAVTLEVIAQAREMPKPAEI